MTEVPLPDEVVALYRCPDCDSDVTAVLDGSVMHLNVAHDDSCPWHQQQSDGQPFIGGIAVFPDDAKGG